MTSIIEVKQLTKQFNQKIAVNNISFQVHKGICFGLLGPNGAGKTTTIEMLEGITSPSSGQILFYDKPISNKSYQHFGIQFQKTALQDHHTVKETLQLFASFYTAPLPIEQLVSLCDLSQFIDQDHRQLSGGQKQRLLLALALVNDPEIIFLDEPTTGLDPSARRQFWDLVEQIKRAQKTIILTTHYMDEAEALCDDIVIMDQGQIIAHNSPQKLLSQHFSGTLLRIPAQNLSDPSIFPLPFTKHNGFIEFNTDNVEQTLQLLLQKQIQLTGLQIKSATLDDLFLKLTGYALTTEGLYV